MAKHVQIEEAKNRLLSTLVDELLRREEDEFYDPEITVIMRIEAKRVMRFFGFISFPGLT